MKIKQLINKFEKSLKKDIANLLNEKLKGETPFNSAKAKIMANRPISDFTLEEINAFNNKYDILGNNSKTKKTIDFYPGFKEEGGTCERHCSYCYVFSQLKVQGKAMSPKLHLLTKILKNDDYQKTFYKPALRANIERQLKKDKEFDILRWFGSGDYQPEMFNVIYDMAEDFKNINFYIISKTLTTEKYYDDLFLLANLGLKNVFFNLSFEKKSKDYFQNHFTRFNNLRKDNPNVRFAYTLDRFEGIHIYKKDKNAPNGIGEEITNDIIAQYNNQSDKNQMTASKAKSITDYIKEVTDFINLKSKKITVDGHSAESLLKAGKQKQWFIPPHANFKNKIYITIIDSDILEKVFKKIFENSNYKFTKIDTDELSKIDKKYLGFLTSDDIDKRKNVITNVFSVSNKKTLKPIIKLEETKKENTGPLQGKIENPDLYDIEKLARTKYIVKMDEDFVKFLGQFDVIFNVNRGLAYRVAYDKSKLNFCACDIGKVHHHYACLPNNCNMCFTVNMLHKKGAVKKVSSMNESTGKTKVYYLIEMELI